MDLAATAFCGISEVKADHAACTRRISMKSLAKGSFLIMVSTGKLSLPLERFLETASCREVQGLGNYSAAGHIKNFNNGLK